jgi:hypothetical protein
MNKIAHCKIFSNYTTRLAPSRRISLQKRCSFFNRDLNQLYTKRKVVKMRKILLAGVKCQLCLVVLFVFQGCSNKDKPDERFKVGLPQDATYHTRVTKEEIYTDPIHGFFEVVPPQGFRIDVKHDKTTYKISSDSPGAGKIVPASRVYFKRGDTQIGVTVSETFETGVTDVVDMDKLNSGAHGSVGTVHLARWITINDAPGVEIILTIRQGVP